MAKQVIVHWLDASAETSHLPPEAAENSHCYDVATVGFLLKEDDREVVLAMEHYNDGERKLCRHICTIPKISILYIEEVAKKKIVYRHP